MSMIHTPLDSVQRTKSIFQSIQRKKSSIMFPILQKKTSQNTRFLKLHKTLLQEESQTVEEYFQVFENSGMDDAIGGYLKGIALASQTGLATNGEWKINLDFALKRARHGSSCSRLHLPEQRIKCYEIMCICFLALRTPEEAVISILQCTRNIFEDIFVKSSLARLKKSFQNPNMKLSNVDFNLLSLLFNRVCGVILACEKDESWTVQSRQEFRTLFRENKYIKNATNPEFFQDWNCIQSTETKRRFMFWRRKTHQTNEIRRNLKILSDLCHSNADEMYRLGDIKVIEEGYEHNIVPRYMAFTSTSATLKGKSITMYSATLPQLFALAFLLAVFITKISQFPCKFLVKSK